MAFSNNNNNQELGLGLGLGLVHGENCRQKKKKEEEEGPCSNIKAYPSLTLGPQQDSRSSQSAVVSSFSNSSSSIKRERDQEFMLDLDEEENKKNNNPWKVIIDVDDENNNNNGNPRKKLRLTKQQSALLEDSFKHHSTLNPKQKQELAKKLNLRVRQVEVWFQNRRARTKLKQTEAECEVLKKWCERLREENKRLQKELQHLKSMKTNNAAQKPTTGTSLYVQVQVPATVAAASLTTCPSCESNNNNDDSDNNRDSPFIIPSKLHPHHFYETAHPFTQSSAAC